MGMSDMSEFLIPNVVLMSKYDLYIYFLFNSAEAADKPKIVFDLMFSHCKFSFARSSLIVSLYDCSHTIKKRQGLLQAASNCRQ